MPQRSSRQNPHPVEDLPRRRHSDYGKAPAARRDAVSGGNETQRFTDKKFPPTMGRSSNLGREPAADDETELRRELSRVYDPRHAYKAYECEEDGWEDDSTGRGGVMDGYARHSDDTRTPDWEQEDLLSELRMVARREARALQELPNAKDETYFRPPTPVKQRLEYIKEAKQERQRVKAPRLESESSAIEVDSSGFKSFNDFDEDIFKFDQSTKMFNCPWEDCDKAFPSLSRIKRHYIIHTDIKPFKCLNPGCDRRFSRKDNMLQHCRVHCQFAGHGTKQS